MLEAIQFPRKLFFFEFGNPKVTVHKCAETIQGRKLFKGGNYMRKYGIQFWYLDDFLTQSAIVWGCFFSPGGKQEMLILKTMKKSFEFQF